MAVFLSALAVVVFVPASVFAVASLFAFFSLLSSERSFTPRYKLSRSPKATSAAIPATFLRVPFLIALRYYPHFSFFGCGGRNRTSDLQLRRLVTFLLSTPLFLITTHPPACVFSNDIFPPFVRVKALAQTHIIKKHQQGFPYRCFFTISIYHFSIAPITFILL